MPTTLEKTWQHSWNYAPTTTSQTNQAKNIAWFFKAFLMGQLSTYYNGDGSVVSGSPTGAWTCYSSSDGAGGFGNGDTTDRWTASFDATKIVGNTAGSNHSWFVLKSPVGFGPVYITIDMNSATATIFSVLWSKTAPSAGTATARPTAADEVSVSNWASTTFSQSDTTQHCHGSLSANGDFSMFTTDAGGFLSSAWLFQKLADTRTGDTYPWAMYYRYIAGGAVLSQSNLGTVANWGVRNFNGSGLLTNFNPLIPGVGNISFPSHNTIQDFTDGLYADWPMYSFNNTGGAFTLKGRFSDLRWCPQGLPTGFCEPSPLNPVSCVMGHIWVPTYVAPIL
jgi:hypothetical protein